MVPQNQLKILQVVYNRRVEDIARAVGISAPYASLLLSCQKPASPEMIARLEAAIVGPRSPLDAGRGRAQAPELAGSAR
jgi:hypothetical protein